MEVICRGNCSGKTKELIKKSLDTNTPILVFSPTKQKSLEEKSLAYFEELVSTIMIDDAKLYSGDVLIDDVDENIDTLVKLALHNTQVNVNAVTISI